MSASGSASSRSNGHALVVGQPAFRGAPAASLNRRGFLCTEVDEPYEAMVFMCRRPLFYFAVILSLNSLYREELSIIAAIKKRFSHIDIWLSDTDGRQAALAEAMRQGADGLFAEDGLHRIAPPSHHSMDIEQAPMGGIPEMHEEECSTANKISPAEEKSGDPLLTADELRALLQNSPNPS